MTIDIKLPPIPVGFPLRATQATRDYARAAIKADRQQRFETGSALRRFQESGGHEEQDPIERLRFFCSIAMSGEDWLDVEPFFDSVIAERQQRGEPEGWRLVPVELIDFLDAKEHHLPVEDRHVLSIMLTAMEQQK